MELIPSSASEHCYCHCCHPESSSAPGGAPALRHSARSCSSVLLCAESVQKGHKEAQPSPAVHLKQEKQNDRDLEIS